MSTEDTSRTRDVAGILRLLTPQQMAEEIVRLDAVIVGQAPNIQMGRLPPPVGDQMPYCIEGLVWAVAYGDNREVAAMFDTPQQAHGFVNYLKRFVEPPSEDAPADPCPQCERGGVCKTPTCGRLRSSELMRLYGPGAPGVPSGKEQP